jgi:CopA family copper-resistance protein
MTRNGPRIFARRLGNPAHDGIGRRQFVRGLAAGGVLLTLGGRSLASAGRVEKPLSGRDFDLEIAEAAVDFTGRPRLATAVNASVPAPTLRWREGDDVTIRVSNRLDVSASIHWHGVTLPYDMDGVPGLSYTGIAPGSMFTYRFPVRQSGTYWYHSHSGFQEQTGLYGALVIDPREPEPFSYDRDYVVMLSDWTDEDPDRVLAHLKKDREYYNYQRRTLADMRSDRRELGPAEARNARHMWNEMRMSDRDLSDVTGSTYTYLMNGHTPAAQWRALFAPGERIRLRLINGSSMTFFDIRIPGLPMTVVATDGQHVEPVTVDELRLGVAETYDVIVAPNADSAYCVFAQAIDRSGYACGTLAAREELEADVPQLDPVPRLEHVDMGMAMAAMSGMGAMQHAAPASASASAAPAAGHSTMDHSAMNHASQPAIDHSSMSQGAHDTVSHPATERGPGVDMRAASPQSRLDDPGVGLRNRPWRVLTYGDLKWLGAGPDRRDPDREIELHLTGNMYRYMWSFDGVRYSDAEPIELTYGQRIRFTLVNDTMMNHPIHLHGMWSDLETGADSYARKHTVTVQPGQKLSYLVTADARGPWAYHCHLLYHMAAGMFRVVSVR